MTHLHISDCRVQKGNVPCVLETLSTTSHLISASDKSKNTGQMRGSIKEGSPKRRVQYNIKVEEIEAQIFAISEARDIPAVHCNPQI